MTEKLTANLNIIQRSGVEIFVDPITADLNIIQTLDDEPNDVGGLSAAELKAKFDEAGNIIKNFINESLIPQVVGAGATEARREAAETVREANEAERVAAETAREAVFAAGEEARNFWEDYDPLHAYVPGNKVYYLGSSYVNTAACTGVLPTVAANWQMIAKKGADSDEGMSQEEGDLRYLQLTGGVMTGAVKVMEPTESANPATKAYADALEAAAKSYTDGVISGVLPLMPVGVIVIWSGTADSIPAGWALCDGQDGRPNLLGRFVLGAGDAFAPGSKGGEAAHTLTINEMPPHSHSAGYGVFTSNGSNHGMGPTNWSTNYSYTTGNAGGGQPHNNMPPYYALCYIIKVTEDTAAASQRIDALETETAAISAAIERGLSL